MHDLESGLLGDIRVINFGTGIVAGYSTKLLGEFGAVVVNLEPPAGDPLRRWSSSVTPEGDSFLYEFLHAGQRSVAGDIADHEVEALIRGADAVIETGDQDIDPSALQARFPALSVVSITPFGRSGPWSGNPATEFTLQAGSGSMWMRGSSDREPLQVGGRIGEWIGGSYAAVATLAAVRTARASGRGDHADISLLECMAVTMNAAAIYRLAAVNGSAMGHRRLESPGIEMTADGTYVGLTVITGQQYLDLFVLVDRAELADEWGAKPDARLTHRDEVSRLVREWMERHTTAEILERAELLRIPASVVGTPDTIPEFDHFARGHHYRCHPRGFLYPRPPFRVDGEVLPACGPAPSLAEMDAEELWPARQRRPGPVATGLAGPLGGVRIVDLTAFGRSVVYPPARRVGRRSDKIEAVQHPDPIRFFSERPPAADLWWEWGPKFNYVNTNKRDVTLDLAAPTSRAVLDRLLASADVLVENFTPRVMDSFDLGWDRLHATFPKLNVVRMPAFGLTGPWRDHPGYAHTIEQASGMAWLTGYDDGPRSHPPVPLTPSSVSTPPLPPWPPWRIGGPGRVDRSRCRWWRSG